MRFTKAKDVVKSVQATQTVSRARRFVPAPVSRSVGRTMLKTQKNAPSILFVSGVVGVVATAVLTAKATLRVEEVLDDAQAKKEKFALARDNESAMTDGRTYDEKDYEHDMFVLSVQTAGRLGKLYGPAIAVGVLSIAALTKSHNMLNRRNAAVAAAYAAVEKSYSDYRRRVVDELGENKDREFRYGVEESTEVEETTNGPKKVKKKGPKETNGVASRFFGPENPNWVNVPEHNLLFLRNIQGWANDRLRVQGHLFLNDVFDDLGMDRTGPGSEIGWLYGEDVRVDFGVWADNNLDKFHDFATGREDCILLEFNVQPGTINKKI